MARGLTLLKLGGELLEAPDQVAALARTLARVSRTQPLAIVHGGGREIDAALAQAGIPKRQVDGLRITDEPTRDIVVSVVAGAINTRFVAALGAAGLRAVGLTGAGAGIGLSRKARPFASASGEAVDLGLVAEPSGGSPALVLDLVRRGYVPVVACVTADRQGTLLNVNADTLAAHLASTTNAARLVIAGGTAGVLDDNGHTIPSLDRRAAQRMIAAGTANAGMVAKLTACRRALARGVGEVWIVSGREPKRLAAVVAGAGAPVGMGTRVIA